MRPDRLVLLLEKDTERFVFFCDDEPRSILELCREWGRMAADPTIEFSLYDAGVLMLRLAAAAKPWWRSSIRALWGAAAYEPCIGAHQYGEGTLFGGAGGGAGRERARV